VNFTPSLVAEINTDMFEVVIVTSGKQISAGGAHKANNQMVERMNNTKPLLFPTKRRTGVADAAQVLADARVLPGRHSDGGVVVRVGDAQVLAVNVH